MKDEELKLVIHNVLRTDDGFKLINYLIEESGCLSAGINFDTLKEYYLRGKKDFGSDILSLVKKYSFENYIKILKERED